MWSALLLALVPVATHPPPDLVAAATASARPAECRPAPAKAIATVWSRARSPRLARYCDLIARAQVRLGADPAGAEAAARAADELLPGRAAPKVALARLAVARGDHERALELFEGALAIDTRSVEQPAAMHDLARAQKHRGRLTEALSTYRVLVPRASLLPDRATRAQVLLEAAHVALAAEEGDRGVEEALAYLREAARDPHHGLRVDVSLSLVLALHRSGQGGQADGVLAELRGRQGWVAGADGSYLVEPADLAVLRGLALEEADSARAAGFYREAIAGGERPNAAVARDRLGAISGPARRPR